MFLQTIVSLDDLREWVSYQLADEYGRSNHRFSIVMDTRSHVREASFSLRRQERRSFGKPREEVVPLHQELGRQLLTCWPTSDRTGGRSPQTPASILRLLGGERAVRQAELEARERRAKRAAEERRRKTLEQAAKRAFPDFDQRDRWLNSVPLPALGGHVPAWAARESDEALATALSVLAPLIASHDAAERERGGADGTTILPFRAVHDNIGRPP